MENEKTEKVHFSDVLGKLLQESGYRVSQVAERSGVPRTTIVNWLEGVVKRPHVPLNLLKVARALHLDKEETEALLKAAGLPCLVRLHRQHEEEEDAVFFKVWL